MGCIYFHFWMLIGTMKTLSHVRVPSPVAALLCGALLLGLSSVPCLAQSRVLSAPDISQQSDDSTAFYAELERLARENHLAFVVEGVPRKYKPASISPTDPITGRKREPEEMVSLFGPDTPDTTGLDPLAKQITEFAAAWDYTAQKSGPAVYVLQKRYRKWEDLPSITLKESIAAVSDALALIKRFNTVTGASPFARGDSVVSELLATLTPEQLKALQETEPNKALSIRALTAPQQKAANRIVNYFYVQSTYSKARGSAQRLRDVENGTPVFQRGTFGPGNFFGYNVVSAAEGGAQTFVPVTSSANVQLQGDVAVVAHSITDNQTRKTVVFKGNAPQTQEVTPQLSTPPHTLAQAVEELSKRPDQDSYQFSVDEIVGDKFLTVVGSENAARPVVFRAMATAYGLYVKTDDGKNLRITRPSLRYTDNVTELAQSLYNIWPEVHLRAMHVELRDALRKPISIGSGNDVAPNSSEQNSIERQRLEVAQFWRKMEQTQKLRFAARTVRDAAVKQLRQTLEPRTEKAPDHRVPLSELTPQERVAFANILLSDVYDDLKLILSRYPPDFVTRKDELYLTGTVFNDAQGSRKISVFLSLPNQEGKLQQGPGVGNIGY